MRSMASVTASKLSSGSPIPISTTLVTARSSSRTASHTWPAISAAERFRLKPCLPVEQNAQSSGQPTWEDTHRVPRRPSGMNTISMQLPESTLSSHLRVPSAEVRRASTTGARISATSPRRARSARPRSVMGSKSLAPRAWIHLSTWRARKGRSPSDSKNDSSRGRAMPRRLARSAASGPGAGLARPGRGSAVTGCGIIGCGRGSRPG